MAIIGIDLGTTNSLAACFQNGQPVIIPNAYGEHLTPSVVSVDENGEIFVGRIAKERLLTHPAQTANLFKRAMGAKKEYLLNNRTFKPEELSACIIRRLKEDAEIFLGEAVEEAVVSVPAYFNDAQRRATKTAGQLAGLTVERIVNEPTAAAVAYGLQEKRDYTKYLVFDLGGGTFDVSILEKYENVMEVRAVAGDNYLGGEDFSEILAQMLLRANEIEPESLSLTEQAALRKSAEVAKRAFAEAREVVIECVLSGEKRSIRVTAEEYEKQCETLLSRLRSPIKRTLSDSSISLKEIDAVLLVGGATKLPLIKTFVSKLLGRFPAAHIDPDEVVALGTAVHAAMKIRNKFITEIVLTDVCPHTLGTNISVHKSSGLYEPGHFFPIIERNSTIPTSRSERLFTLHDNQKLISVEILQGESRKASDNVWLGELEIPVPQGKAGKESVDVRYTYDINGILEVEVTVVSTQQKKTLVIQKNPGVMSESEVAEALEKLQALKIHPRNMDPFRYLMARGERLYEESVGDIRRLLGRELEIFEDLLDRQDNRAIRDYAAQLKELLDEIEENREF